MNYIEAKEIIDIAETLNYSPHSFISTIMRRATETIQKYNKENFNIKRSKVIMDKFDAIFDKLYYW